MISNQIFLETPLFTKPIKATFMEGQFDSLILYSFDSLILYSFLVWLQVLKLVPVTSHHGFEPFLNLKLPTRP